MMIELDGVSRTYHRPDGGLIHAVNDVTLQVDRGELVALVGASGSGKSTLMNVLGLLDRPSSGSYRLEGREMAHLDVNQQASLRNQKVGFVFQSFHLLPRLTALENVELPLLYSRRAVTEGRGRAALAMMGIDDRADHTPTELSGGQQQRVAIARALVNDPDLLLADEPTGNLDVRAGREIMEVFRTLNDAGRTIVVVTHDPGIAELCTRVARLEAGRLVADDRRDAFNAVPREAS